MESGVCSSDVAQGPCVCSPFSSSLSSYSCAPFLPGRLLIRNTWLFHGPRWTFSLEGMVFVFFFFLLIQVLRRWGRVSREVQFFQDIYLLERAVLQPWTVGIWRRGRGPQVCPWSWRARVNSGVSEGFSSILRTDRRVLVTGLYGCFRPTHRRSSPGDSVRGLPRVAGSEVAWHWDSFSGFSRTLRCCSPVLDWIQFEAMLSG